MVPQRTLIKGLLLLAGLMTVALATRLGPLEAYISQEQVSGLVQQAGIFGPVSFIALYAVAATAFVPGAVLVVLGVAIFGLHEGFLYVWLGALLSATTCFFIGRYLGQDFARAIAKDKILRYDDLLRRNGFSTTLYMRLLHFPTTAMNYGMGLTSVTFRDFFLASAIGMLLEIFVYALVGDMVHRAWTHDNWELLWSGRMLFAVGLFMGSLSIPTLVKRFRKRAVARQSA